MKADTSRATDIDHRHETARGAPVATLALRMQAWKHDFLRRYFPGRTFVFAPFHLSPSDLRQSYSRFLHPGSQVFVWSVDLPGDVMDCLQQSQVRLHFVEDGFLRSNRAFASRTMPLSLSIDSRTAHFDASRPSDLETLLETHPFGEDAALMARARAAMSALLAQGITKYNGGARLTASALYGEKQKRRVLVLGQVDDDASIRFGCPSGVTQTDLVHAAVAENPDCDVIFRPHPDVVNRIRPTRVDLRRLSRICRVVTAPASLADAFATIDHVYTLTSLGGFEALMRGIPVTVFGYPFYAGWGATDDRSGIRRRQRRLGVEALFAGAYLLYPRYFDPATGASSSFEDTIRLLQKPVQSPTEEGIRAMAPGASRFQRAAIRMIEPVISRIGSKDDGRYFMQHPFSFFQERPSPALRRLGRLLFEPPSD